MGASACSRPARSTSAALPEVIRRRQEVLAAAYAARPDRFVAGPPRAAELAAEVWINRPIPVNVVDGGEEAAQGGGADGKEGSLN